MKHPIPTKSLLERKSLLSRMPLCNMVRNFALFEKKSEHEPYTRSSGSTDSGRSMFANFFKLRKSLTGL